MGKVATLIWKFAFFVYAIKVYIFGQIFVTHTDCSSYQ